MYLLEIFSRRAFYTFLLTAVLLAVAVLPAVALGLQPQPFLSGKNKQAGTCSFSRALALGMYGEDVRQLQQILKELGYYQYPAMTGYFGPATKQAVERFQCQELGICSGTPQTTGFGRVGPQTQQRLQAYCQRTASGQSTSSVPARVSAVQAGVEPAPIVRVVDHQNIPEPRNIIKSTKYGYFHAYAPSIIKQNGIWHLFYCSNGITGKDWDSIRYATSTDGLIWSEPQVMLHVTNMTVERAACDPSVVYYDAGDGPYYYLFYSGNQEGVGTVAFVARAKYIDGPYAKYTARGTWEVGAKDPQPIIVPVNPDPEWYGAGQSSVVVKDGVLYHWFTDTTTEYPTRSRYKIFLSTSTDPVRFSNPVRTNVAHDVSVDVKYDQQTDQFVMFAMSAQHSRDSHITIRTSKDGVHWSEPLAITPKGIPALYAHNPGVSGTKTGTFIRRPILVAFGGAASGKPERSWGRWDLYAYRAAITPDGRWQWLDAPKNTSPTPPQNPQKVAEYLFEGRGVVVQDTSGYGNHGLLENGARRFAGIRSGNKLELDGVDDRVRVQAKASLQNLRAFTLAAWIRPTQYAGIILYKGNTHPARFSFGISAEGKLYLRVGHEQQVGVWQTVTQVPLNTWSHVAVTYREDAQKPALYINGRLQQLEVIAEPVGALQKDTSYLYIGNNHDLVNRARAGFDSAFEGRMDNVFVFNGVLSAQEIARLAKPKETPPQQNPNQQSDVIRIEGPEELKVGAWGSWVLHFRPPAPLQTRQFGPWSWLAAVGCSISSLFGGFETWCPEEGQEAWIATVSFGDKTPPQYLYITPNQFAAVTHAYQKPGTYTITVRVRPKTFTGWLGGTVPRQWYATKKVHVLPKQSADGGPVIHTVPQTPEQIYDFWTPERMQQARPMPMPHPDAANDAGAANELPPITEPPTIWSP